MLEPVVQFLDRGQVGVEVARVHRAQVARGVVIDDAAGVQPRDDRFGPQGPLDVVGRPLAPRALWMPSIMSGFMSSS